MKSPASSTETVGTTSKILTLVRNAGAFSIGREDAALNRIRRLHLLPKEILHIILDLVYRDIIASPSSSLPSANRTSDEEARKTSLAHRILDTETLRRTCSTFHEWALYHIAHPHGHERLEIDFSDFVGLSERMNCSGDRLLRRLLTDFPLLSASSLVLYLGNPGNTPNNRKIAEILRTQPHDSAERRLIGGLSFWESDKSIKTLRSSVQKVALRGHHQTIFSPDNIGNGLPDNNTKVLRKIERCWVRERVEELKALADLYNTIAGSLSLSSYTEIPVAILKVRDPDMRESFSVFMRNCKHVVLREFRGLDEGHMDEYVHELYNLAEAEGLSHQQKLQLQPIIKNIMWRLNKMLWPSEHETWCKNRDTLKVRPGCPGISDQNVHLSLKSSRDKVHGHRVWHLLDDNFLLAASPLLFANISSLTITGGVTDNVTLFGLLTALSATPDTLQSLIYLPGVQGTEMTRSKHPCPLFRFFKSLVDVHISCFFCPEALEASRNSCTDAKRRKRWRVDWPAVIPCPSWRDRTEREKQIATALKPCTTLATLLENCRSVIYAVDGHYSKIWRACGKYGSSALSLELAVGITRKHVSGSTRSITTLRYSAIRH